MTQWYKRRCNTQCFINITNVTKIKTTDNQNQITNLDYLPPVYLFNGMVYFLYLLFCIIHLWLQMHFWHLKLQVLNKMPTITTSNVIIMFLTHPSRSRDIEDERSLLQLPFPRRSCLLREPLMYPSSRLLNSLSRSGGCVREPHSPVLGAHGGVITDAEYGKLGRRRFRASGSCSIVSYRVEDITVKINCLLNVTMWITHETISGCVSTKSF